MPFASLEAMETSFVILTHSDPAQVARLARSLAPAGRAFIHVNAESDVASFREAVGGDAAFVEARVRVQWGTCSLLDAILSSLREAIERSDSSRFVLLSQSCRPIRTPQAIGDFFRAHPESEYIGMRRMRPYGIDRWRLSYDLQRNDLPAWSQRGVVGKVLRRTGLAVPALDWRTGLGGMAPAKGCLWWALTRPACEHLLREIDSRSELMRYARSLFGPEEIIPHTVMLNSPFADRIRHHLTYEDWSQRGPSPKWLAPSDIEALQSHDFQWRDDYGSGEALFARKFRPDMFPTLPADQQFSA